VKGDKVKYIEGYKYQLVEDYTCFIGVCPPKSLVSKWVILSDNGFLTIRKGYAWNGASGPTWDTKNSIRASLLHDAVYQLIRLGLVEASWKEKADNLLHDVLVEDGMNIVRAEIWEEGVEHFGKSSTLVDAEPKVLEAP
jgi:hypothetical protein